MTNRERTGFRDAAYSAWHRSALVDSAQFMDIDWIERCHTCHHTLAIYETAFDNGKQDAKAYYATREIALRAGLPGFLVLYQTDRSGRISAFRVKRIAPGEPDDDFVVFTPDEWAERLRRFRICHPIARREQTPPTSEPVRCATCGAAPTGKYGDGSPRFSCYHAPLYREAS